MSNKNLFLFLWQNRIWQKWTWNWIFLKFVAEGEEGLSKNTRVRTSKVPPLKSKFKIVSCHIAPQHWWRTSGRFCFSCVFTAYQVLEISESTIALKDPLKKVRKQYFYSLSIKFKNLIQKVPNRIAVLWSFELFHGTQILNFSKKYEFFGEFSCIFEPWLKVWSWSFFSF